MNFYKFTLVLLRLIGCIIQRIAPVIRIIATFIKVFVLFNTLMTINQILKLHFFLGYHGWLIKFAIL